MYAPNSLASRHALASTTIGGKVVRIALDILAMFHWHIRSFKRCCDRAGFGTSIARNADIGIDEQLHRLWPSRCRPIRTVDGVDRTNIQASGVHVALATRRNDVWHAGPKAESVPIAQNGC